MHEAMEQDEEGRNWIEKSGVRHHREQDRRAAGGEPPRQVEHRGEAAPEPGEVGAMEVEVPEAARRGEDIQDQASDADTDPIWRPGAAHMEVGPHEQQVGDLYAVDVAEVYKSGRWDWIQANPWICKTAGTSTRWRTGEERRSTRLRQEYQTGTHRQPYVHHVLQAPVPQPVER